MSSLSTGTVSFLCTDIEESTALLQRLGGGTRKSRGYHLGVGHAVVLSHGEPDRLPRGQLAIRGSQYYGVLRTEPPDGLYKVSTRAYGDRSCREFRKLWGVENLALTL